MIMIIASRRKDFCAYSARPKKILGNAEDLNIEIEYQQETIGKFGLEFDGTDFVLTEKKTACLAKDTCGSNSASEKKSAKAASACCSSNAPIQQMIQNRSRL